MNFELLMVLTGFASLLTGSALLLPLIMAFREATHQVLAFLIPAVLALVLGGWLIHRGRNYRERLLIREGALLMLIIWALFIFFGMLPYIFAGRLGVLDAFCESVSGFTTTGITLLSPFETRPVVFWRSLTQWVGGLNIIMLLVTIMPQINSGISMKLVLPPNMTFGHLLRSMRRMANGVGIMYISFTALAFGAYYVIVGLNWFDSANMAMVTMATGGCYFSPAVSGFTKPLLEVVAMVFMLVSSGNFLLYWQAARRREPKDILDSYEMRCFLRVFLFFGAIVSLHLWHSGIYDFFSSLRYGFFETASFISTTGFFTARFPFWPDLDRHLLFLLIFVGGCIGSSAGGFKVLRFMILLKAAGKELKRILHPHMVVTVFFGNHAVPGNVVGWVLTFFFLYIAVFFGFSLLISLEGIGDLQSMGVVAACLGNVGAAALWAENVGSFAVLSAFSKLLCCILMLLGRIEIFSVLVVLELVFGRRRSQW